MLRLLDPETDHPCLVLDGSGVSDWLRCGQYYGFRHHVNRGGIVPAEDSVNLVAGSAVHAALEVLYRHRGPRTPELWATMQKAQLDKWTSSTAVPDWRSPAWVEALLKAYLDRYPDEPFAVREVEAPFARALGQVRVGSRQYGVIYQGRRDMVVAYRGTTGDEWVVDHKTAQSESNLPVQWGQSLSQLGYCWSREQLTGRRPAGWIMNVLLWRKPVAKESKLPRFDFFRVPVNLQQWMLEEWKQSVLYYAQQIIERMLAGQWPKNPGSCLAYGARCPFWEPCTSPPTSRERLIASGSFRRNDWSPLRETGTNAAKE